MTEIPPERAAGARKNDQKKPKITLVRLMCAPREINGHEKTQKQAKNRRSGRERNTNFVHNCGLSHSGWKCTIAARTCLNVINPAQINALECADIFKSAYMYAPVFGYCAPRAPRFFERETHGSEIDKKYDMDHLPALRSKAPPDKGGCSMSRCGYNL